MRLNNLPKEVLESEFPNLVSKAIEKGYLILDNGDDGRQVIIARPTKDGKFHGKMYELNQPKDEVIFPSLPDFSKTLSQVNCDSWDGRTDGVFRDDYNNNLKQIQHTINELVKDNLLFRKYIEDLQTTFKAKQDNLVKLISLVVSDFLDDNYYPKAVVDKKLQLLEARLDNLQKRVAAAPAIGPYANSSRTDQYPTNLDINDKIADPNDKAEIDRLYNEEGGK